MSKKIGLQINDNIVLDKARPPSCIQNQNSSISFFVWQIFTIRICASFGLDRPKNTYKCDLENVFHVRKIDFQIPFCTLRKILKLFTDQSVIYNLDAGIILGFFYT